MGAKVGNAETANQCTLTNGTLQRAQVAFPGSTKMKKWDMISTTCTVCVKIVHQERTRARQTWTRARSAHLGTPNQVPSKRRACPAAKENTTMSRVRRLASFAKQTPLPRIKAEPPNAPHVQPVVLPWLEVHRAKLVVWPGNTKKPQARAKKIVPLVQQERTRAR